MNICSRDIHNFMSTHSNQKHHITITIKSTLSTLGRIQTLWTGWFQWHLQERGSFSRKTLDILTKTDFSHNIIQAKCTGIFLKKLQMNLSNFINHRWVMIWDPTSIGEKNKAISDDMRLYINWEGEAFLIRVWKPALAACSKNLEGKPKEDNIY